MYAPAHRAVRFQTAGWSGHDGGRRFLDADYPADPYPGSRPSSSYVHQDGVGHALLAAPPARAGCVRLNAPSGFVVATAALDVDRWLDARGAPPLDGRTPVLAYGSNACPSKLTWLRENLGLAGPVVVLRARCAGFAAVWAAGVRARDGQRPVTLMAAPGVMEDHAVLLVTEQQLRVLDACEGADTADPRYRREVLPAGTVTAEGSALAEVHAYVGARGDRVPRLVDGAAVRAFRSGALTHPG